MTRPRMHIYCPKQGSQSEPCAKDNRAAFEAPVASSVFLPLIQGPLPLAHTHSLRRILQCIPRIRTIMPIHLQTLLHI